MLCFDSLAGRLCLLVALFGGEALAATLLLDGATPTPAGSLLAATIRSWGPQVAQFAIAYSALFATFAFLRFKMELRSSSAAAREPMRWSLLAMHSAAIGLFALTSARVYGDRVSMLNSNVAAAGWIFAVAIAIASAALAFLPWKFWTDLARATGNLWVYAAAAAILTTTAATTFRSLWRPASGVTFQMVRVLLSPFVRDIVLQPENMRIGTHRFTVVIADQCSGLEGIGLLLVFGLIWLVLFRHESRFPQALILLPLGIVTLFMLNAFRITALILIGNAGAREIAAGGFHSQAGWIAFNSVAFASCIVARRWSWVSVRVPSRAAPPAAMKATDSTAALLVPFLSILCAGMIARAASGGFEWLYPVRLLAAVAALWVFRRRYSQLEWTWNMWAPVTGFVVFLLWTAADPAVSATIPIPAALTDSSTWVRDGWIGLRILGAIFAVPIAEELAFRGYLLRRFTGANFDSISFPSTSWVAVLGSSVLFGCMHGERWWLGTLAGLAYAVLIRKTGRIGDAVVAHAVTNALLAVCVLAFGQWQLW